MIATPPHLIQDRDALRPASSGCGCDGAIFLRAEYRESWAYESMTGPVTAALLRPGHRSRASCSTSWHRGLLGLRSATARRHWAASGDVIVLPYGDQHTMGGEEDAEVVPIAYVHARRRRGRRCR